MDSSRILVVDDDPVVRETLTDLLTSLGARVMAAADGAEAFRLAVPPQEPDVAIVDLHMPGMPGLEVIRRLKEISPETEMIILTGEPSVETSLEAIYENVFDYLVKPVNIATLKGRITRAIERRRLVQRNRELSRRLEPRPSTAPLARPPAVRPMPHHGHDGAFVGRSALIQQVRRAIAQVAHSDMTVLLRGESGTGKDVIARMIHEMSGRHATGEFIKINCPAIPETLLESELFGHEAGSFTGADRRKPGRFELADKGTIFLDEIADLPLLLQSKLLQVIEHKQFSRIGGRETIRVDARIIAATNAPLEGMIAEGAFRTDLFYRLNEYSISIPPLRQRAEDVPVLFEHFLRKHGAEGHAAMPTPEAMAALMAYHWPGNVRELEALVRRYNLTGNEAVFSGLVRGNSETSATLSIDDELRESETRTLLSVLNKVRWNRREAARILGISYGSLRRRIDKYGLKNTTNLESPPAVMDPAFRPAAPSARRRATAWREASDAARREAAPMPRPKEGGLPDGPPGLCGPGGPIDSSLFPAPPEARF